MQNRFPSSTKNSGREEEEKDSSRVFLNACDEPASQLNPDRDKIFNFPENNFSNIFRSAAPRLEFSHLGKLLLLRNLRKCITSKFFATIQTVSLVLAETQKFLTIMRELPVWSGTLSWHLKTICYTSEDSSATLGKLMWREWGTMKSNFVAIPISRWKCFIGSP